MPTWLSKYLQWVQSYSTLHWFDQLPLPPLTIDGYTLTPAEAEQLVALCLRYHNDKKLLETLKAMADPAQMTEFLLALYRFWQTQHLNVPIGEIVASLGTPGLIPQLLDIVESVATPVKPDLTVPLLALQHSDRARLHTMWQWLTDETRRENIEPIIAQFAREQRSTLIRFGERAVPPIQFNEQVFDYGSQRFYVVLSADLRLRARDEAGKLHSELPEPLPEDHPAMVAKAQQIWRDWQRIMIETSEIQRYILERAMLDDWRWTVAEFDELYRLHPLQRFVAQGVIWGVYQGKTRLAAVRLADDLTFADIEDRPYTLPTASDIRLNIIHPLHLWSDERLAWLELLNDYDLVQPFPQMGRTVHTLDLRNTGTTQIIRRLDRRIQRNDLKLPFLRNMGWDFIPGQEAMISRHFSQFATLVKVTFLPPPNSAALCQFKRQYGHENEILELQQVNPLVISETLVAVDWLNRGT